MSNHLSERYKRQLQLPGFGPASQEKLSKARVLVVGAGGLGVPVLQYLAGMGIGSIGIVDADVVSLSNLHRQILYNTDDIGQPKVMVTATRLKALNPEVEITPFNVRLDAANAIDTIAAYDLVVDATDNFDARYLINDACVILAKPFVYGAVHQYEGHVSVFNFEDGPTYRCLYPTRPTAAEIPDCNTAGVLGVTPGIIGCRQALEAVKLITGIGKSLSGYLQVYDFLNDEQYKMKLKTNPANKHISKLEERYDTSHCTYDALSISADELRDWYSREQSFSLIDVREPYEFEEGHLSGAQNIPLSLLINTSLSFDNDVPAIVYCQMGGRSTQAVSLLRKLYPGASIFDLQGGYDNWLKNKGKA